MKKISSLVLLFTCCLQPMDNITLPSQAVLEERLNNRGFESLLTLVPLHKALGDKTYHPLIIIHTIDDSFNKYAYKGKNEVLINGWRSRKAAIVHTILADFPHVIETLQDQGFLKEI